MNELKESFDDILNQNKIRFFMSISDEHMLFHPFPSKSIPQSEGFRKVKTRDRRGIGIHNIPQMDGSSFYVYRPLKAHKNKHSEMRKISFYQKVQDEFFPECVFWPQRHINLGELRGLLAARQGFRLSYLIYFLHQFADSVRVLPLLVDWVGQVFYDVSCGFVEWKSPDGFGVRISNVKQINEMHLQGIKGFKVIEYLSNKRVCLGCGRPYDINKERKGRRYTNYNTIYLD